MKMLMKTEFSDWCLGRPVASMSVLLVLLLAIVSPALAQDTPQVPIRFLHAYPGDIVLDAFINISPLDRPACIEVQFGSFCNFEVTFPTGKPLNFTIVNHHTGSVLYYGTSFTGLRYNSSIIGYNLVYAPRYGSDTNETSGVATLDLLPDVFQTAPSTNCFYLHVANYFVSNIYKVVNQDNNVLTYDLPYGLLDITSDTCWTSETYNLTLQIDNNNTNDSIRNITIGLDKFKGGKIYLGVVIGDIRLPVETPYGPQIALRTLVLPESGSSSGSSSSSSDDSSSSSDGGRPKKVWLYVIIGVLMTVLVVAGALAYRRYRSRTEYSRVEEDPELDDSLTL